MLLFILSVAQLSIAQTEEELNVKADAHFKNEEYVQATPLYLRLLSLQPRDHNYNYRYGTCLLFNSDKKQDAFKYLNYAAKGEDVEVEVFYFLGKAFHLTFEFNKAIQYYTKYKQVAGNRAAQNLDVDRQIEMAQNGKRLLSRISELIIESRKLTALNDFFRLYDLSNIGGTLLVTEEFQTKLDKKNNHVPLIHFPAKPTQIYYSSFGDDGNTGKDIYVRRKLPDGSWGKAQKIAGGVNTNYDEEFPYMHPNGRYLYFSSKGHNSMGGYDVFRAPYFPDDDSFGDPENLDFAISSPDDDLFYVVDSLDKNAFFASARQSQEGKIHVYKMRVQRSPDQMIILKGNFISKINPANKVISIQVKDVASGRRIGSYKSNSIDGGYIVTLPKGGKYEYTMQVQGEPDSYTEVFQAPFLTELKPLKQSIVEYEENGNIVVQIFNLFDEEIEDASDILAEVLKNKSQLQPNSDAFDLDALDRLENEKKLLADLNLDRYNTIELSDIAKTDLEKFTLAQKEIENELNKLLMVANNAIKSAHNADSIAESLIAEAKTVKNKAKANAILDQALAEKRTAQREIQKAEQALVLHKEMQKAKKLNEQNINNAADVNNILKDVNSDNLKEKMNELATKQGEYIKRNFNASSGKSAAQELYSKTEEKTGLSLLNKTKNELLGLEKAIQKRENEIKKLESEKEFAKKKELEDIERKIEQLSADNRADKELISIKQKEIERESIKENNAIAQKSAIDNTRDIADNEIRTDLSLQSVDNLINQFKTIGSQESVDAFEKSTNKLRESLNEQLTDSSDFLTDKYQESQNANESTNKTIQNEKQQDISSNKTSNSDVASKNETSELVSQLNPSLNAQEERVRLSSKSPEEKAKERLAIEKQWVVEISKEINRKETELKQSPTNATLKKEIEQLKKELSNKKAYIDELKPLGDPETKEEVIAKTSIQTANPNYYENKKNAERISNISDKLNALTNNDNELIKALNERKDNLSNVNSEDAITERKIIDSLIAELETEINERDNMVALLGDTGIDPIEDYSEADTSKDFRDALFGGSTELKNLFEQSQVLKSTAQSLMDKEKQLEIQKELLSKSTNKLFEIDAALQRDPNNEELKAFKKGLEELMSTVESEINITETSIEQLSDSNQHSSEVSQVNAIQREIEELSAQNVNNETILTKHRELLKAIDKATEIVAKKLEKNPTDQQANDERNALKSAKEATLDAIAELEQALIAQQNDKSSTPSATTISDKQVNSIQREIENLVTQNANNQTILAKQRELLKAIDKAAEIVAKKLEKNPTDQQANDERNALQSAKEATLDAIAELEQAELAKQQDGNTPTLSENEFISNSRKTNNVEDAFTISENTESEKLISARIALNTYLEKLKIEKNNSTDENRIKSIASEVNRTEEQIGLIDRWLSEMEFVYRPEEENGFVVSTNDDINTQQLKVAKLRSEIDELERKLTSVDEKERKKLEKELSKLNDELFNQEKTLVINQKDDLTLQSEEIIESQSNNNSEIGQANSALLTIKTEQTIERITALENAKKKNQDEVAQKAIETRNELVEQQNKQRSQIERSNVTNEVIKGTNLTATDINENFEKERTINALKSERERIQLELNNLKRERQSASKKRIPIIDVEIANMTRQVEQIDEKIQNLSTGNQPATETLKNSVLAEKTNTKEHINELADATILAIAKEKGYKNLSNKINELQLLEHRLSNLEIEEANMRNAVLVDIEAASTEADEDRKRAIITAAQQKAQQLESISEEIRQLKQVVTELNNEIIADPLYDDERKDALISMALEGVQPIRIKPIEPFYKGLNFNANSSSYSSENPIPINPKMPDGLVYKVQVGAFSKPVPEDTFKEFNPISGEQINNGLVRYMVGVFAAKGEAYMAQNKVRSLGYSDAFVVAYCGGQRMTVAQADQLIKEGKCRPAQQLSTEEGSDYLAETNNAEQERAIQKPKSTYNQAPNAAPALAIEDMRGLFFTVQVGVYNYPIPASRLYNISPLNTNLSDKGQIRYSTGRFDDIPTAINRRNEVRQIGISDAFVTAYYNGTRITIGEARKLLEENGSKILYNNIEQADETFEDEGETTIVFKPKEETRRSLDENKIMRIGISADAYSYYPKRELDMLRQSGAWVYFDENTQRIKTLPTKEDLDALKNNSVTPFNWKTTYMGYTVDDSKGLFYESIEDLNLNKTVYELEVTWTNNMPQLLAGFMYSNTYTLQVWSENTIVFGAIDYQSKEEIKNFLRKISGIETIERIIKW